MSAWGAVIMSFFGSMFAALTLRWQLHAGGALLLAPFLAFAVITLVAAHVIRLPGTGSVLSERAERAIMWSSIAEGVGIFLVSNLLVNLQRPELLLPAIALIVGLHFLPIAYAASYVPFFGLGGVLIVSAGIGVVVHAPIGGAVAGGAAAASLWGAAILGVRRDWRAKTIA